MRFAPSPAYMRFLQPSGDVGSVGDGRGSSIVAASLNWIARTFPEAPLTVSGVDGEGQLEKVRRHLLTDLVNRPNPYFTGRVLWMATVTDYNVSGDAYWLKVRDEDGVPVELWWVPSWSMTPKGDPADPSVFIDHYAYQPGGGEAIRVPVSDVVHFRFGVDPQNMRVGLSPLASVLREVWTDDEAARFTAAILGNMGVPGLVISPDQQGRIRREDAADAKEKFRGLVSGERRGEPIVMTSATRIEQFGFSPEQLNLRELRRVPEERVSAVLGVPAVVAGLGAGLDRSTFTNMGEARDMAYESGIIPTQTMFADEIRFQLLPDFEDDPHDFDVSFDLSHVRVLQSDRTALTQRAVANLVAGAATLGETRRELGLPVDARHDVFYRPVNVAPVPAADPLYVPASAQPAGAGGGVGDDALGGPKTHPDIEDLVAAVAVNGTARE